MFWGPNEHIHLLFSLQLHLRAQHLRLDGMEMHGFFDAELHGVAGGFLGLLGADRPPVDLRPLPVEARDEEDPARRVLRQRPPHPHRRQPHW